MFIWIEQAIKDAIGPAHPGHLVRWYRVVPWVRSRCRGQVTVLDAGCGDGGAIMYVAAKCPEAHFMGVDIQAPQSNRSRAAARGLPNIQFEQG